MSFAVGDKLRASALNALGGSILVGSRYYSGTITSTGTEVAIAAWTAGNSSTTFTNGHLYALQLNCDMWNSGTAGAMFDNTANVRKTVNSTSSLLLLTARLAAAGGSAATVAHTYYGYVQNVSGTDISASLGVTVTKSTGTNANMAPPIILAIYDLGAISGLTDSTNTIAGLNVVSIT